MHMLCTYKPDSTIECEHLCKLFARVGVKLPSRETFSRVMVRDLHKEVQLSKQTALRELSTAVLVTDGWRNGPCSRARCCGLERSSTHCRLPAGGTRSAMHALASAWEPQCRAAHVGDGRSATEGTLQCECRAARVHFSPPHLHTSNPSHPFTHRVPLCGHAARLGRGCARRPATRCAA